eukprot:UN03569
MFLDVMVYYVFACAQILLEFSEIVRSLQSHSI